VQWFVQSSQQKWGEKAINPVRLCKVIVYGSESVRVTTAGKRKKHCGQKGKREKAATGTGKDQGGPVLMYCRPTPDQGTEATKRENGLVVEIRAGERDANRQELEHAKRRASLSPAVKIKLVKLKSRKKRKKACKKA